VKAYNTSSIGIIKFI